MKSSYAQKSSVKCICFVGNGATGVPNGAGTKGKGETVLHTEAPQLVLGNNSRMELWSASQDMVLKPGPPMGNKQKATVGFMSLFCLTHLLSVWLNDTANKIKPDLAGYGGHAGALGYAGRGAKGNGNQDVSPGLVRIEDLCWNWQMNWCISEVQRCRFRGNGDIFLFAFAGNGAASASLHGAGTKGNGKTVPSDLC